MSRKGVSKYEPMTPRVLAAILVVASLVLLGIAALLVFLAVVINQYLPPDLRLPPPAIYYPLIVAVATITTFAFFYIFYVLLYESYRS
jgi:uncharacterized RDD family membrane protein YckC